MQFRTYTQEMEPGVQAFNERMRRAGMRNAHFPESHVQEFPYREGGHLYQDYLLTLDKGNVRGGYKLKHQAFWIIDRVEMIAAGPQGVVSEGIIDPTFRMVGVSALRDALRRQPLLYGLGMGGLQERLPKLMKASGWSLHSVPFYFRVIHPSRFLRNIQYLREQRGMRFMCDLLQRSRLGALAISAAQLRPPTTSCAQGELTDHFGAWADELWRNARHEYSFAAVRHSAALNVMYNDPRMLRMRVLRTGKVIGWAVMLDTQMSSHKQFGDMRVGSMVDCMALPGESHHVVCSASRLLKERGVDIIVSNQSHDSWRQAFVSCGFLRGKTNFILGLSPELSARLDPQHTCSRFHVTRGDGDGPIHL